MFAMVCFCYILLLGQAFEFCRGFPSMRVKLLSGLALSALVFSASPVIGQDAGVTVAAPFTNSVLEDVRAGQPKRFIYELEATAYFLFIPVTGRASFDVSLDGDTYSMTSHVKTTGIADIFVDYDMRLASSGYVQSDGLQTYNYISQNHDGKKNRRVEMIYGASDVDMVATPAFGNLGFPPATPEQKLEALDPITALINASFQPREADAPCGGPITTFDGKQLTRLNLTYVRDTNIRTKAWRGEGIECHVQMERVAGYKEGDRGKNLSGIDGPMRIFFAEAIEGMMIPVRVEVDTEDIGRITLQTSRLQLLDVGTQEASAGTPSAG